MSSRKDEIKKKFQQNKINRVQSSNKKYKKATSKSDQNYIKGNYTKSVGQKVYGVKKNLAEGKTVSGYGSDYVDTKGMKRSRYLAKQEGKNPYEVTKKYTGIARKVNAGVNSEGEPYDSYVTKTKNLTKEEKESFKKTGTLYHPDYRAKEKYTIMGSHKGKDAKKFSDHLNFQTLDGMRTAMANQRKGKHLSNVIELGKGLLKDTVVDAGMDMIKSVGSIGSHVMAGITGFAEDSGNVFQAIADPKRDYKYYSEGRSNILENLKSNQRELDKTGFGHGAGVYLNEAKDRADKKQIKFLEETGRHQDAEEYRKKVEEEKPFVTNSNNVVGFFMDMLAPTTIEDKITGVGKALIKNTKSSFDDLVKGTAKSYARIVPEEVAELMSKADKYSGSSKKASGASDSVFYSGKKGNTSVDKLMDDSYAKRVARDNVSKNPNTPNLSKYLETIGDVNTKPAKTTNPFDEIIESRRKETRSKFETKFENIYQKYSNDIEGLTEKLDSMKPKNADAMYSYLQRTHPEVYEQIVRGSDDITDILESTTRRTDYRTQNQIKADEKYFNTEDLRKINSVGTEELRKMRLTKQKNYNLLKDILKPKFVDNVGNIKERESLFRSGLDALVDKIGGSSEGALEEISVNVKNLKYLIGNKQIGNHELSKVLNDFIFDGKDVIRRNIKPSQANQVLDYLDEMVYRQANGIFEEFDKAGNLVKSGESAKLAPSFTDYRYEEKMSNLASKHGVKTKRELTSRRNELRAKKKQNPLSTDEYYELQDLENRIKAWDDEYKQVKYMVDEYDDYAKKAYPNKDVNAGYETALDELAEQQMQRDIIKEQQVSQSARDLESNRMRETGSVRHQQSQLSDVGEVNVNRTKKEYSDYRSKLGINYVKTDTPIKIPKDKQTLKNVRAYNNVDNAISNLEKLIIEEASMVFGKSDTKDLDMLRRFVNDNVKYLRQIGVDDKVYFNRLKQMKLKLLSGDVSLDTKPSDILKGTVRDITKGANPLEMAHIKINGKAVDNLDELTPDQLQWQYLRTQGAKTIDELFDAMPGSIPQRGDNIGDEISSVLRQNTPIDNIPSKNVLDDISSGNIDNHEYVDEFERIIAWENEQQSLKMREALKNKSNVNKPRAQMSKHTIKSLDDYLSKLNMPTPQTIDELDFPLPPGVDEDGVIHDLTNALNKGAEPTFEQFKEVVEKSSNDRLPYEDTQLYNIYKSWLNSLKKGLTVYNPGWHIQNFFQNKGQNYLALGAEAFAPQTDARQILKHIQGKPNKNVDIFDSVNKRVYSTDEVSKLAQDLGVVDGVGEDIENVRSLFPALENAIDNSGFMKKLGESEQTARLHHFVTQLRRGMSPEQASKSVNKYLFDYGDKSKVDKVISDFIDPFWMFHKNNAKLLVGSAFENPDKMNRIVRGTKGLEYGVPEGTEQREDNKHGKLQKPYANITDRINKDDYNYLFSENMMPDFEDAIPFERDDFENKLNPILRIALQQMRGEGNFGNTIVEGDKANWGEVTKEERKKEIIKDLNPILPNLINTLDSVKERRSKEDKGAVSKATTDRQVFYDWLNYITGNKGNWYRNSDN